MQLRVAYHIRCDKVFEEFQRVLAHAGFACQRFLDETSLLLTLRRQKFDLVLVDTDSLDGSSFYSWLSCRTGESMPVVLLAAECSAEQIALTLESGADDFIRRPVEPVEFLARLNAILRRYRKSSTRRTIELLGFSLDRDACRFLDRGVQVDLTPREFSMAWLFFSSPGIYLSRETISVVIWGVDSGIANRTIEQHVYKLRKKLNLCTERGARLRAAYTKGYRLEMVEVEAPDPQEEPAAHTGNDDEREAGWTPRAHA